MRAIQELQLARTSHSPPLVALVGSGPPTPGVLGIEVPLPGPPLLP
jgi:hypothetical protein